MKAFQTLTVSTTVVGFNSEIFKAGLEKAQRATITVETAGIRYRVDGGEPSSIVGLLVNNGDIITLDNFNEINLFKAIRSGAADATLNVDFGPTLNVT